jgi:phospholipid/cholesterol/gamma-HCH transport system substrate-binding protein
MGRHVFETLMGAVVLVVAGLFLVFAYSSTNVRPVHGYNVIAKFERVDGLAPGSDVRLSGIKVGTVVDQKLEPHTYLAVVTMSIDSHVRLPVDTVAQITSEGLLGANFLSLVPGADEKVISPGGELRFTQSPVNLVQMLGKFIFNSAAEGQGGQGPGGPGRGGSGAAQPAPGKP